MQTFLHQNFFQELKEPLYLDNDKKKIKPNH